ncbi:alanine racemase [Rhabdothermincola sediminis]|uniref:alanine racemase n=1 Tax=Rhabdothermincola sediminis TaxID=2751370 RepID=UPI001F3E93CF|nr:alanine racemase [Rhabdothermincola sediminis]
MATDDPMDAETAELAALPPLPTPAPLVRLEALEHNLAMMAAAWPGNALRPHVKAFKSTALARLLADRGHPGFCCATIREMEGLAAAGLGQDLLLANEVLDATRLGALVESGSARVTVAVDSAETIGAAVAGGVPEVLIDVNVGLPRCGCPPESAGLLAGQARAAGLVVRGVMGYEGHVVGVADRAAREAGVAESMTLLAEAHRAVGGEVVSGGGTGTWDLNRWVTELQAGSFLLMDTAYAALGLPFRMALSVLGTVISVNRAQDYAVADVGLKALGMDHGNPRIEGFRVWFCSDEHVTFAPREGVALPRVGDRVRVLPAHVDPTVAYHERFFVVRGGEVVDEWPIDLRGW